MVRLILFTGLRRGEALGLHWPHIDFDRRHLVVEVQVVDAGRGPELGEPKTRSGRRIVPIDQGAIELLEAVRSAQQDQCPVVGAAVESVRLGLRTAGRQHAPSGQRHRLAQTVPVVIRHGQGSHHDVRLRSLSMRSSRAKSQVSPTSAV